jgi:hypothetical protein
MNGWHKFYTVPLLQMCMFIDIGLTHKVSWIGMTARWFSIYYLVISTLSNEISKCNSIIIIITIIIITIRMIIIIHT